MDVYEPSWSSGWRWCIVCPGLPILEQDERIAWCKQQGMDFSNIGVRFWFKEEAHKNWFVLRWS